MKLVSERVAEEFHNENEIPFGKLVRNNVPDFIRRDGQTPVFTILENDDQYERALLRKLVEEACEADDARSEEALILELADVVQVLSDLAHHKKIAIDRIFIEADRRRNERGDFRGRLFLEKVTS